MKNNWDKFFLGFFIVTVISGIYLIFQKDYISGISGSIVGVFLVFLNMNQIKNNNSKYYYHIKTPSEWQIKFI